MAGVFRFELSPFLVINFGQALESMGFPKYFRQNLVSIMNYGEITVICIYSRWYSTNNQHNKKNSTSAS